MYIKRIYSDFSLDILKCQSFTGSGLWGQALMPQANPLRIWFDFTGDSYRLVFKEGYATLAEYESLLTGTMGKAEW